MSTLDRYNYTSVYDDGTVVCRERKLPRNEIPEEEMKKKKLLFDYHFEGPDHPYANANNDWIVLKFQREVTASQLKKILDSPDIESEAREHVRRCIAPNSFKSEKD